MIADPKQSDKVAGKIPVDAATIPMGLHADNPPCIELRRIFRFFGTTKAVQDISFTIPRGSVFGYIGPNGAGKTTSMRILATLDLPSYGEAFIDGLSCINDPELVRHRLGYMPDSYGTYRDVNCWEYLDFYARAYGLTGWDRLKRLRWVLDFTGTGKIAEKPIRGLSKGMKQRLCLGRALIHDPSVLILDEPAAGLDPRARIELRQMIGELASRGKTIIISSHILTELAEMCDRVGIIEQGRLLATGTVDEIQRERAEHRELVIRLLSDTTLGANLVREREFVNRVSIEGELLRIEFTGDMKAQAELVTELVRGGCVVAEAIANSKSLEDVFLQVTEGLVQ